MDTMIFIQIFQRQVFGIKLFDIISMRNQCKDENQVTGQTYIERSNSFNSLLLFIHLYRNEWL